VAVIEGHDIGGTCVNRGCVPSKALLAASGRIRDMKNEMHMKSMGIQVTAILLNCVACTCAQFACSTWCASVCHVCYAWQLLLECTLSLHRLPAAYAAGVLIIIAKCRGSASLTGHKRHLACMIITGAMHPEHRRYSGAAPHML
jgi:hypothetical protein